MGIRLSDSKVNILLFITLILFVSFLQFTMLKPALEIGLTPDDWAQFIKYKTLLPNPIASLPEVWKERGAYTTYQIFYIGMLENLVGINYQLFQSASIIFKIIATLTIFPVSIVIFKNKLLAFLTTILYSVSYNSAGSLEYVVKGTDYLAISSGLIFLTFYYRLSKGDKINWKNLLVAVVLLIITLILSPIRLYPLLFLIPFIEIYLIIKRKNLLQSKKSLLELLFLYSPFLIVLFKTPEDVLGFMNMIPVIVSKMLQGNWHLFLTPLQGVSSIFLHGSYLEKIFGFFSMDSFSSYFLFLINGSVTIFDFTAVFLAIFTSKNHLKFFLRVVLINFILDIVVYFIATHSLSISSDLRLNFDKARIYPTLFGLFIMVLAFNYYLEWKKENTNELFAIWIGPLISFFFIFMTWLLADVNLGFGGIHNYLVFSTLGGCLFLGGIMTMIYNKCKLIRSFLIRIVVIVSLFLIILIPFYTMNNEQISYFFNNKNNNGRGAAGQVMIQTKFRNKLKEINFDYSKPGIFYFDTSEMINNTFYMEAFLSSFPFWMHFDGHNLLDGCMVIFYDKKKIMELVQKKDSEMGFLNRSFCIKNGRANYQDIFYSVDNLYAYKIKDNVFLDIKKETLEELGFK